MTRTREPPKSQASCAGSRLALTGYMLGVSAVDLSCNIHFLSGARPPAHKANKSFLARLPRTAARQPGTLVSISPL